MAHAHTVQYDRGNECGVDSCTLGKIHHLERMRYFDDFIRFN